MANSLQRRQLACPGHPWRMDILAEQNQVSGVLQVAHHRTGNQPSTTGPSTESTTWRWLGMARSTAAAPTGGLATTIRYMLADSSCSFFLYSLDNNLTCLPIWLSQRCTHRPNVSTHTISPSVSFWELVRYVDTEACPCKSAAGIRILQQSVGEKHTFEGQRREAHDIVPVQPGACGQRVRYRTSP